MNGQRFQSWYRFVAVPIVVGATLLGVSGVWVETAGAVVAEHNSLCSTGERCFAYETTQNASTATDVSFSGGQYADPTDASSDLFYRVTYPAYYESPYPLRMARNRENNSLYRYLCIYLYPSWGGSSSWLDYFTTNWTYTPSVGVPKVRSEQIVRASDINNNGGCPAYYVP